MIEIKKFTFNPFQENTYIVNNENKECFIVDPGCYDKSEQVILKNYIEEKGLKPVELLNTHCHIDHVFGNRFIFDEFGLVPKIHLDEKIVLDSTPKVAQMYGLNYFPSPEPEYYSDNHVLLGNEKWDILFAPGHSPGHVMFHNKNASCLIAGDVIFRMSMGRTDLPGGDHDTLLKSIREQVFSLPDETDIYSGHMEETTVGFEKINNPFLR